MTYDPSTVEADLSFRTLNHTTRLLASESNLDILVQISLNTLADFGRSNRVEFISLEAGDNSAKLLGLLKDGKVSKPDEVIPLDGTVLETIIQNKNPLFFTTDRGDERFGIPLIGSENNAIGLIVLDRNSGEPLQELEMQSLVILTTLISMSLEHTRFFQLSMYDDLTGLYVRRQFDAKLREEMARINRYGGNLAIFIADIDDFKVINDVYGHLQGDIVLQELAGIFRNNVRNNVDIPCRFAHDEMVVIMPNTDADGAVEVAERFRFNCEQYSFSGQTTPLKLTVSIGVSAVSAENAITMEEFIEHAKLKLNKAKEAGKNKVLV